MQKTIIYRKLMSENLFEEEFTIEALSQLGNPLEQLAALVDFEMFRPALEDVLVKKDCKTPAGRPRIDVVLMFMVIFLQRYSCNEERNKSRVSCFFCDVNFISLRF